MNIHPKDIVFYDKEIKEWRANLYSYSEIMKKIMEKKQEMLSAEPYRTHDDSIACAEAREEGVKEGIEKCKLLFDNKVNKMRKAVFAALALCVFVGGASYTIGKLHGHEREPGPCKDEAFYFGNGGHAVCTYEGAGAKIISGQYTLFCICPGQEFAK